MFSFLKSRSLTTGLAMFSMFFGAGNVIFPLALGYTTGHQTPFAVIGLLLTAVGVPFMGLIGIILSRGNYASFFERIGKIPGFLLVTFLMLLLGPFGALPRCIALSYSTLNISLPSLSTWVFSTFSCLIIFFLTFRKSRVLDILGKFLTPALLVSLFIIVIGGFLFPGKLENSPLSNFDAFTYGFIEGYNTMDLLASFFFCSVIYNGLKDERKINNKSLSSEKHLISTTLIASGIGAFLLSVVYIGFSLVAAHHASTLKIEGQDQILGALTFKILGPHAGLIASLTIVLACLTTAVALAAVFAEFLQTKIFKERISYSSSLAITLLITSGVSCLEFNKIVTLLSPLLQVVYPALILLTFYNIFISLWEIWKGNSLQQSIEVL